MSAAEQLAARLRAALTELRAADEFMTTPDLTVRVLAPQIAAALHAVDTALVVCEGDAARTELTRIRPPEQESTHV